MNYNPSAFLVTAAALTSIFSFFFGVYFQERTKVYSLWLRIVAFGAKPPTEYEVKALCGEVESKDRLFTQAKGLLAIILLTLIAEYVVFQAYSYPYVSPRSLAFSPEAYHSYRWYNAIIGLLILINCLEMLYIRVAVDILDTFPYLRLRKRVAGQERLFEVWCTLGCPHQKLPAHAEMRKPSRFYREIENKNHELLPDSD